MRVFSSLYLLLLGYVIAALVFWGFSLQKQSQQIYDQQVIMLKTTVDSTSHPYIYNYRLAELKHNRANRIKQYLGEGGTFLFVILIGAFVVSRSIKRSLRLSRQQNNFMLAVTHELKSPIAAIKLNLQTLEKHQLDEQKKQLLIERCIREANRLNDLCNNMLLASQIEGRQYKAAHELLDFSELVEGSVKDYAARYYPRRFEEDLMPECKLYGDRTMLQIVVNNLLENAVKYAPADKPILTTLACRNNCAYLQVIDQGVGIPAEEKRKVFTKFYRLGNEESRKTKGTGLGLYLVNKIIYQHKGHIALKDNQPSGLIFEVSIPID